MSLVAYRVDQAIAEALRSSPSIVGLGLGESVYCAEAPDGMSLPAIVFVTSLDIEENFSDTEEEMKGTCEVNVFVGEPSYGIDPVRRVREICDAVRLSLHRQEIGPVVGLTKCQLMLGDGGLGSVEVGDERVYATTMTFQLFAA